jgi:3-hydroxyacyl-[acyl-carrier-protein] dehydratase
MPLPDIGTPLRFTFTVPADHPSLAGHFPGAPVVPGVVVLDYVLSQLAWPPGTARRLAWVKFNRWLLPERVATATLSRDTAGWRFIVTQGEEILVQGVLAAASGNTRVES